MQARKKSRSVRQLLTSVQIVINKYALNFFFQITFRKWVIVLKEEKKVILYENRLAIYWKTFVFVDAWEILVNNELQRYFIERFGRLSKISFSHIGRFFLNSFSVNRYLHETYKYRYFWCIRAAGSSLRLRASFSRSKESFFRFIFHFFV